MNFVLPKAYCEAEKLPFLDISPPEPMVLMENQLRGGYAAFNYGKAHAFIGCVENCQVIGTGSLVIGDTILAHGLSSGNYRTNISIQLQKYVKDGDIVVPQSGQVIDEAVLLWGCDNFGHWLFTHLQRLTLLHHHPELFDKPVLVSAKTPKRFLWWLDAMGFKNIIHGEDGCLVRRLWVPSVVTYRGHYEDKSPFIYPEAIHSIRHMVLKGRAWIPSTKRERIYVSRKNAKWRRLLNEDMVLAMMEYHKIRVVCLEEMSIYEQLDVISRASTIVMTAGGGSPTTMFAPPDCSIVEITNKSFAGTFASRAWAHVLGQKFGRTDVEVVENEKQKDDGKTGEDLTTGLLGTLEIDKDGYVNMLELNEMLQAA